VLRRDVIRENVGRAAGRSGFARGGGIWNGSLFNAPPIELSLKHTSVTRNRLSVSDGLQVQGGGLFTTFPVALLHSRIANNIPDQCYGC
jgi:hypothetical protein